MYLTARHCKCFSVMTLFGGEWAAMVNLKYQFNNLSYGVGFYSSISTSIQLI